MQRFDAYFGQKVTEAEVDEWFDGAENALWNLAIDIGLLGVITGAVLTETSPKSMNIEASAGARAYDQQGKRIYYGPVQTVNCAQDEDGQQTIPSAGKERVIMIELKFKRLLSDLRTDDNGASVYYQRDEDFEINVVAGAEVTAPASYPGDAPTPPSDALILGDIILQNSTTDIATGDIKLDRRQDFVWTDADKIGVTAGSWTKIDSTSDHVQDALDSVDTELISRDATGDIDQTLLPDGNTRDLGSAVRNWGEAHLTDLTAYNGIFASADGKALGSVSARWNSYHNTATIYAKLAANANGLPIGDVSNRFDAYLEDATIYSKLAANALSLPIGDATTQFDAHLYNTTVYNAILASATGKALGSGTARFNAFLDAITYHGALTGTCLFNAAKSVTVMIPVTDFVELVADTWAWDSTASWLECGSISRVVHIHFKPLHGAVMQSMRIRWAQASGTGMVAQIESFDEDNSPTSVGSSKTITVINGSTNWDTIATSLAETIDLSGTGYRVKVTTNAAVTHKVYMLEITYDVTDIFKAALSRA